MGYRIEYGYKVGDVLTHVQTVTMLAIMPGHEQMGGRSELESTTRVLDEKDGILTLELAVKMLKREGLLDHGPPPEENPPVTYTSNRSGAMLSCDNPALPPQMEAFPQEEVEVGTTWQSSDRSNPAQPTAITYRVEAVGEGPDGATCARISSHGTSENPAEGMQTTVEASQLFDLTHGMQLESTSIVKMAWSDGRATNVVVENKLAHRVHA